MAKNMNFKRIIALSLSSLLLFSFSGCGDNSDVEIKGEIESTPIEKKPEIEYLPTYDFRDLQKSNSLEVGTTPLTSFYFRQMQTDAQKTSTLTDTKDTTIVSPSESAYKAIEFSALNFSEICSLADKPISEKNLRKIMNIILIDTPELYMLDNSYSYDLNESGYVSQVYLKFNMTKEEYAEDNKEILEYLVRKTVNKNDTEFDYELRIIEQVTHKLKTYTPNSYYIDPVNQRKYQIDTLNSILVNKSSTKGSNSLAIAKSFAYLCRYAGIDSTVVLGEVTNTDYFNKIGLKLNPYKNIKNIYTETRENNHVEIKVDYSGFYAWNLVKLNGEWYHVDCMLPKFITNTQEMLDRKLESAGVTYNVNDYTISQSRLFFENEELLGRLPECDSNLFQKTYREGKYMLNYNEDQIIVVINDLLSEIANDPVLAKNLYFQFGSEKTYDLFILNFDQVFKTWNENNNNAIKNYKIIENKETLTLYITDIIMDK